MDPVREGLLKGLELPPDYTIAEWAEAHVVLPSELAAEPGPYRSSRTPYARAMMNAQNDPTLPIVCYKTSAQIAKTTSLLMGLGYHIHHDPCPMLLVLPDQGIAEAFSKKKLEPFINGTEPLRERIGTVGTRKSTGTIFEKSFPGGFLQLAGANTPNALRMHSVRKVFADEVDGFKLSSGKDGDPLMLAFKRATTFANRQLIVSSTPVDKMTSLIEAYWQRSDKRLYHVKMPCCGDMNVLAWEHVKWVKGQPETCEYWCQSCGTPTGPRELKLAALAETGNEWRATAPFTGVAGFHIWQIYSPFSNLIEIVREYESSQRSEQEKKVWWTTFLGEPWDEMGAVATTGEALFNGRRFWKDGVIPEGACVLTASVDVQGNRLEVLVVAHGPNKQRWAIDLFVVDGNPAGQNVWDRCENLLERRYQHETHPDIWRGIEGVAIDSGGHYTQQAYDFASKAHMRSKPWFAIKGVGGEGKLAWSDSKRPLRNGAKLHLVGVDSLKEEIYAHIVREESSENPWENRIFLRKTPAIDLDHCEQIVVERPRRVIDSKGFVKTEWHKPPGARNEMLDLLVYAEAVHRYLAIDHQARLAAMDNDQTTSTAELADLFE
jgi:phage terminase large subunit GpA-like protein